MATFKILGDVVNDPSANNIGSATTVTVERGELSKTYYDNQ